MKRKLKKLITGAFVIGVAIAVIAKKKESKQASEWRGLSESEARAKLESKLPSKIPAEKRAAISDKIVTKMHQRGVISDDPDNAEELADSE
jgi:hypothetical protein